MEVIAAISAKYKVIYADPPWQFKTYSEKGLGKSADQHYPTMSLSDIKALPVSEIADKDCALFLWTTIPFLRQSFDVMKSWGFEYKTVAFVWIKRNRKSDGLFWGTGYWTRANCEICMLATRGNPKRVSASVHQVIISRIEEHRKSRRKRENVIVKLMGDVPKIELFARQKVDGWDVWGNEVDCDVELNGVGV